jgi:hypothetical protein
MKIVFLTSLLLPGISWAYTDFALFCSVNGSFSKKVSCEADWVEMRSYPNVKLRLKDCLKSRAFQRLEVDIDGEKSSHRVPKSLELNIEPVRGYEIDCVEGVVFSIGN